ncbi:MAG: LysM peptidoglycan-binding domain-containing protein [Pseudomonadota bacterium]|nr:LysM peptidoglycan-binding domain-containing protein [Pseudomonadota bacterium]
MSSLLLPLLLPLLLITACLPYAVHRSTLESNHKTNGTRRYAPPTVADMYAYQDDDELYAYAQAANSSESERPSAVRNSESNTNKDAGDLYNSSLAYIEHPLVKKWIKYFTVKEHARFQRFLNRGEYYRSYIQSELQEHGLPTDLYYLAMIESGFVNNARSKAYAVGIWQFMRRTGAFHGLLIDSFIDQRMDVVASTAAAISYLQDLNRVYQSWWLAIASYNSGEVRVLRAVMRRDTRDFFELIEKRVLPEETVNYVPKFIAAMHIGRHYRHYGFELKSERVFALQRFNLYRVPPQTRLAEIAAETNCSLKALKSHNVSVRRGVVHPTKHINVRIPVDCRSLTTAQRKKFEQQSKKRLLAYRRQEIKGRYRVRRGDSLYSLARRFNTSVRSLLLANNLTSSRIYAGQLLKIVGRSSNSEKMASKRHRDLAKQMAAADRADSGRVIQHRVRRGESLYRIAKKYDVSVKQLKRTNNLRKSRIYPGQIIKVINL